MWKIYYDQTARSVASLTEALRLLEIDPLKEAKESWKFDSEYRPSATKGFSGPEDVGYQKSLKTLYEENLASSNALLLKLKEETPK
jgi:hypothetical protein